MQTSSPLPLRVPALAQQGSEGEPPEHLSLSLCADGRAGCSLGALAVPMVPSAGTGTGTAPLQAEQVMVLSREQIRRMLFLSSPSPSACLSRWICSIRPHLSKQDQTPRQHNTCRPKKGYPGHQPTVTPGSLVAVPPRALCHHWCPRAVWGWGGVKVGFAIGIYAEIRQQKGKIS